MHAASKIAKVYVVFVDRHVYIHDNFFSNDCLRVMTIFVTTSTGSLVTMRCYLHVYGLVSKGSATPGFIRCAAVAISATLTNLARAAFTIRFLWSIHPGVSARPPSRAP